jgi:hypothetical protein
MYHTSPVSACDVISDTLGGELEVVSKWTVLLGQKEFSNLGHLIWQLLFPSELFPLLSPCVCKMSKQRVNFLPDHPFGPERLSPQFLTWPDSLTAH